MFDVPLKFERNNMFDGLIRLLFPPESIALTSSSLTQVHDMSDSGKQAWIKAHPPAQEKEEAKGPPAPGKEAEAKEA